MFSIKLFTPGVFGLYSDSNSGDRQERKGRLTGSYFARGENYDSTFDLPYLNLKMALDILSVNLFLSIQLLLSIQISRLDSKDVLEITCNLETEGEENTAFILCTTFLTQQLQQQSLYCSWWVVLVKGQGIGWTACMTAVTCKLLMFWNC